MYTNMRDLANLTQPTTYLLVSKIDISHGDASLANTLIDVLARETTYILCDVFLNLISCQ